MKQKVELAEGVYGPLTLKWVSREGLWKVTGRSVIAIRLFRVGTKVANDERSKVFGTTGNVVGRAYRALMKEVESFDLSRKVELPELSGITMEVTEDGLVRLSGDALVLYKRCVQFKAAVSDPSNSAYSPSVLLRPEKALEVILASKEHEAEVKEQMEAVLPDLKWLRFRRIYAAKVEVSGTMLVLDGDNFDRLPSPPTAKGYRNHRVFDGSCRGVGGNSRAA